MNWKEIKPSFDNTHFIFEGKPVFNKEFIEVLKFHTPGLAPVKDKTGAYHIDENGNALYNKRYERTFGFYCNRAAVVLNNQWFHINEKGDRKYAENYLWTGNFQENLCTVRDFDNNYFHIKLDGKKAYEQKYKYAGDFKDGVCCVKCDDNLFRHIDFEGNFINKEAFLDLGVFHKGFATAKDKDGWFHIDLKGKTLYNNRYLFVEPFYNGQALVTKLNGDKLVIDEKGNMILAL